MRKKAVATFKGDEAGSFRWLLFPGQRKQCRQCGREPLRVADVGEHRRLYPSRKTEFLCKICQRENIQRAVRETRERIGLQARPPDQ